MQLLNRNKVYNVAQVCRKALDITLHNFEVPFRQAEVDRGVGQHVL